MGRDGRKGRMVKEGNIREENDAKRWEEREGEGGLFKKKN